MALTEYRGKVYGYSHTTFIVNDTLYYIVKRVKGTIDGDICIVEDDEIVSHNFFSKLDKGVKVKQTFRRNRKDSTWHLEGNWETPKTKKYYALTGTVALQEEKQFEKSKLLEHIGDLKLEKDVAFYKPEPKVYLPAPRKVRIKKEEPMIAKVDPVKNKPAMQSGVGSIEIKNPDIIQPELTGSRDTNAVAMNNTTKEEPLKNKAALQSGISNLDIKNPEPTEPKIAKPNASVIALEKTAEKEKKSEIITSKPIKVAIDNEFEFEERKKNIIQTVTYKTDSLVLALYDNGEVDGDTVSVYFNGEILMDKQGLKSTALKKTIYVTPGKDDQVEILLYAENLGRYPPNTGLLIIRDGEDRYEIRFSADFEQSAAIILKRKKD